MRHGKKINHLSRDTQHRKSLLKNMAMSLILHKRIYTTVAKAKALRKYVEPLINRSKVDSTHSRRMVFAYLNSKEAVKELFDTVSTEIMDRPGGYTRIIKTGFRQGDAAETCMMELVDFNKDYGMKTEAKTTRRSRRGRGTKGGASEGGSGLGTLATSALAVGAVAAGAAVAVAATSTKPKHEDDDATAKAAGDESTPTSDVQEPTQPTPVAEAPTVDEPAAETPVQEPTPGTENGNTEASETKA